MAYGMHGKGEETLELFRTMVTEEPHRGEKVKPNEVTFIAILAACSHSGMVNEGLNLFHGMKMTLESNPQQITMLVLLICLVELVN